MNAVIRGLSLALLLICTITSHAEGFRLAPFVPIAAQPRTVVQGDFNDDHLNDLAVLTQTEVQILLSSSNGAYQEAAVYPLASRVTALVVVDVNNDGKLDLALATANTEVLIATILPGNGDGTFGSAIDSIGSIPTNFL